MSKSIIVAMDFPTGRLAIEFASKIDPQLCRLKVGMELFTASGPVIVEELKKLGFDIFLDMKFFDIPNTVAGAIRSAANMGVWMVNVHASGGQEMMEKAIKALSSAPKRPLLIGVTVLTSMNIADLHSTGTGAITTQARVVELAKLAHDAHLDGVVCSGEEVVSIRQVCGDSFRLVVPGIRLPDGNADDQKRIVTPERAIQSGADYLVIGRPITQAADPLAVLDQFHQRIRG